MPFGKIEVVDALRALNAAIGASKLPSTRALLDQRLANPRSRIIPLNSGTLPFELFKLFESASSDLKVSSSFSPAFSALRMAFQKIVSFMESLTPVPLAVLASFINAWTVCEHLYFNALESKARLDLGVIDTLQTAIEGLRKNRKLEKILSQPHSHEQLRQSQLALTAILQTLHEAAITALQPDKNLPPFETNVLMIADLLTANSGVMYEISGLSKFNKTMANLESKVTLLSSNKTTLNKATTAAHRLLQSFDKVVQAFVGIGEAHKFRFPSLDKQNFPEIVQAILAFVMAYTKAKGAISV